MIWKLMPVALLAFAPGLAAQDDKALFERTCGKCHSLAISRDQHNSRGRWATVVDNMIARGAEATDPEIERIIDYLASNYGPKLAVNRVGVEELAKGLDISPEIAAAVVEYRSKNGPFKSIEDLKKVPTIDAAAIDGKRDRLDFSAPK